MAKMVRFMVVHQNPNVSWEEVEGKWTELANVEVASWERTWFSKEEGVRYCLWRASGAEVLKKVFADLEISWESILEVEETVPDFWKTKIDEYVLGPT